MVGLLHGLNPMQVIWVLTRCISSQGLLGCRYNAVRATPKWEGGSCGSHMLLVRLHVGPGSFGITRLNRKIISSMMYYPWKCTQSGKEQLLMAKVIAVCIISSKWILRAERFKPQ